MLNDTIAAISTPLGEGGLAVVRMSGPKSIEIGDLCFKPIGKSSLKPSQAQTHTVHYGYIIRAGKIVDEVLLTVMCKPRTYTREDMIEISCHGGILPARTVLETVIEAGARLAQPGEFTRRAFLNGRIDLTQAEAVIDIIHSRTELAMVAAQSQLAGALSKKINELRENLMHVLAHIEAHIDFPDEDIQPDSREILITKMSMVVEYIDKLLQTAEEGQILRQGVKAAIIGRPNVGKSSLLNALLGRERAIVSPIAGTTRDTIEETANIRGIPVVFTDTAGLRDSADIIEAEGIKRTHQAIETAELILLVLDASEPFSPIDEQHINKIAAKKAVIIRNKIDLPVKLVLPENLSLPVVDVSCKTAEGLEKLKDTIKNLIFSKEILADASVCPINWRHKEALIRAKQGLIQSIKALQQGESLEFAAMELRIAINAIGEITGQTATEDLLDIIFSQFCIGK